MTTQDLLHRTLKVVVPQDFEHPGKEGKCQLMRFQKRLLASMVSGVNYLFPSTTIRFPDSRLNVFLSFPWVSLLLAGT
jgi:hypothetical protein